MEDREEQRGRRSLGASTSSKDTAEGPVHCHYCQCPLDREQKAFKMFSSDHFLCLKCATIEPAGPHYSGDAQHPHAALVRTTQLLRADLRFLAARQRDFLLRALDATTALKMRLEAELSAPPPISPPPPALPCPLTAWAYLERLHLRRTSAIIRCRLDNLVNSTSVLLDFELMRRALLGSYEPEAPLNSQEHADVDPMLFLANFCTTQLYMRKHLQRSDESEPGAPPLLRIPAVYPLFFFNIEVEGLPFGRFVIEVCNDLAPNMAHNFAMLSTGELGIGYRGCTIFQCWGNESVITGDFELNNGRGGRSVYETAFFVPDDTRLAPVRGSVGMRRSQRRSNRCGRVGSQFRIMLCDMPGFTAIFGYVVEGLELVEQLSCTGNSAGQPHGTILISSCGKLN